ncbi:ABC transporter permease [Rhizobium sp. LC145]|jgi:peptide/nickel transport system permease protein|uniref:ABC transporter permease n=1 Tax=Rhizobium sp. LC145 TaxID=1120688 RepID=UPI000AD807C8|nr:ABC transporter permease [Rhizobium sp. LC145]TKT46579.1 ABC transporter permease [Rhizobiaceae bacterium LC148]
MIRQPANMIIGSILLIFIGGMALLALIWTPYDPAAIKLVARLKPPSPDYWLGTDEFGRDVVSRLMAGASQSMIVAVLTVALAITVGTITGLIAGYTRGLVDRILMVFSDALLAFPGTLLALGLMVISGPNKYGIILALGIAYSPSVLRVVRASVLSAREREYVEASRVIGNSEAATMFFHVLPNCIAPIVVLATSMFGWVVLAESGLSFLGLGVPPPAPTWGNMLSAARTYIEKAPWLGLAPGICISMTLLGINLLGDALRDRFDPRMEQR